MPTVSVIIPTYNRACYVTAAIDSVLSQSYDDYEIIVIDDGSTDRTQEVLKPYLGQIRYIVQPNQGASAARNAGVKEARGDWIAFLDSDDLWRPHKLKSQLDAIECTDVSICFTGVEIDGGMGASGCKPQRKKDHTPVLWENLFELYFSHALYIQTALISRELAGYFDERLEVAEDTKYIFNLAYEGHGASYIPEGLTVVNRHKERAGLVCEGSGRMYAEHHCILLMEASLRTTNCSKNVHKSIAKALSYALYRKAEYAIVDGNRAEARRLAKISFVLSRYDKVKMLTLLMAISPFLYSKAKCLCTPIRKN